jgi:hypothetical protein
MTKARRFIDAIVNPRTVKELKPAKEWARQAKGKMVASHPDHGGDAETFKEWNDLYRQTKSLEPEADVLVVPVAPGPAEPEPPPEPSVLKLVAHVHMPYANTYRLNDAVNAHLLAIAKLDERFRANIASRAQEEGLLEDGQIIEILFVDGRETERFSYDEAVKGNKEDAA